MPDARCLMPGPLKQVLSSHCTAGESEKDRVSEEGDREREREERASDSIALEAVVVVAQWDQIINFDARALGRVNSNKSNNKKNKKYYE